MNMLGERGIWLKANLHTHTTRTDGRKTPEEVIDLYRRRGYSVLALTDHWVLSETEKRGDMLLLSGMELDTMQGFEAYHLVGIGMDRMPEAARGQTPQQLIDAIREAGGVAILAHPAWSLLRPDHMAELTGLAGSEVMNSVSMPPHNGERGDSASLLDIAAACGSRLPFMAADDSHFYEGEECTSYLWIHADELTKDAVLEAIRRGHFFASRGPRFFDLSAEDGKVHVTCTPCSKAVFYSDAVWNGNRVQVSEDGMHFTYPLGPNDHFIRCELVDAQGRKAWSSPFAVKEGEIIR